MSAVVFPIDRQRLRASHAPSVPDEPSIAALCQLLEPVKLKRGTMLCEAGDKGQRIGWVDQGLMRSYHLDRSGQEFTKIFFPPGSWFITGFEPDQTIAIALQACTDTVVWVADLAKYQALLARSHAMAIAHIALLYHHLIYKHEREVDLLSQSSTERYLRFVQRFEPWIADIPLAQVATHLGMTPTQLSRIRKKLGVTPRARTL